MAYSYKIWNDVQARDYRSSKSYGAHEVDPVTVRVGTGANNSETLVEHLTTAETFDDRAETIYSFSFRLPDQTNWVLVAQKRYNHKTKEWLS